MKLAKKKKAAKIPHAPSGGHSPYSITFVVPVWWKQHWAGTNSASGM